MDGTARRVDLVLDPVAPSVGTEVRVRASDGAPLTNVELEACTPRGPSPGRFVEVTGAYTWAFSLGGLAFGETQLVFRSDPDRTVRATRRIAVRGGDLDAGAPFNPRPPDVNYDWTVIEWDLVAPPGARRAVIWLSGH